MPAALVAPVLAPRFSEDLRRAYRQLQRGCRAGVGVAQGPFDTQASHVDPKRLDSWIAIAADGRVTAYTGKCELGQGMLHRADPARRRGAVAADRSRHAGHVRHRRRARSGDDVRQPVDADEFQSTRTWRRPPPPRAKRSFASPPRGSVCRSISSSAADGVITARADASKRVSLRRARRPGRSSICRSTPTRRRKPAADWTVLGKPVPRLDMAALATGTIRVRPQRPQCRACCTARSCGRPRSAPRSSALTKARSAAWPGVVKVVVRKNFVGVVAEKPWQAHAGRGPPGGAWSAGSGLPPQSRVLRAPADAAVARRLRRQLRRRRPAARPGGLGRQGDLSASVSDARIDRVVMRGGRRAAAIGPRSGRRRNPRTRREAPWRCCSASRSTTSGSCSRAAPAATGSTAPTPCRSMRRCCRRRSANRCGSSCRARTKWPGRTTAFAVHDRSARRRRRRRDDRRVGLRGVVRPSLGGRPGYNTPGNVVTGMLAGFAPAPFSPRTAPAPTGGFNNGSNAAPSYIVGRVGGSRRRHRARSPASASSRIRSRRRSSPVRCGRRRVCRTPSRTSASSTRSRRPSRPIRSRIGCATSRDPATASRRRGGGEGGEVGRRGRRRSLTDAGPASRSGRGMACVALRRGQRLRGDDRRG